MTSRGEGVEASDTSADRTDAHLSVGEVAAAAGVATSAVRFYEQHGLITGTRTASNQRRFDELAPCRIKVAKVAQRVGLTVREIAEILAELPAEPRLADWEAVTTTLIAEARARVAALQRTLEDLGGGGKLCELDDPAG